MTAQGTLGRATTQARPEPTTITRRLTPRVRGIIIRQFFVQLFLLIMLAFVMFPVLWIISMAVDPRGITRPTDLNLIPANANLNAFQSVLTQPFSNVVNVYFGELLMNSLFIALGTSLFTVVLGSSAAYAFSRFRFIGRQFGMLVFIVLLMLPTTGVLIPLYVLFNSVQINPVLAQLPPALFAGGLIGGIIWLVYSLIRSLGRYSPDRAINPSPAALVGITAVLVLLAIIGAFTVMFVRGPIHRTVVEAPLRSLSTVYDAAREDYEQRVGSVAQRDQTATRREERAEAEAASLAALIELQNQFGGLTDAEAISALMNPEIEARQGAENADDDLVLQSLLIAQPILESGGVDGFKAGLTTAIETAQEEVAETQAGAESARANAEEARANLAVAEQTLNEAREAFNADAQGIYAIRDQALIGALPYMLLAWGAALVGAVVVWGIVFLVRNMVEPRVLINILALALVGAVTLGLGWMTLGYRLETVGNNVQTLRSTLLGLSLAFASAGLPFAIWNLKGYFDTIPKELEEAALIDGAGLIGTFVRIMVPLALPAFAIVILFSFMSGWTEFILSWLFLTGRTESYTLAMALASMAGGSNTAPPDMQKFAAMSILISLPILILFFAFQRWIVGGLAIGGVKG